MALRGKLIDALANKNPGDSTSPPDGGRKPYKPAASSGIDAGRLKSAASSGIDDDHHKTAGDNIKTVYRNRNPIPVNYSDRDSYDRSVVDHIKKNAVKNQIAEEISIKNEVLYTKNDYSGFKVQARESWDRVKGLKLFNSLMKDKEVQSNNIIKKERV